jgi:predicted DNA-binding transcriptional regulator YafY
MAVTGKDQIAHGIEFIALAWKYRVAEQELSLEDVVELLLQLIHGRDAPGASLTLKNANNWKRKTENFFGIVADLQQRSLLIGDQLFNMASFYLRSFADAVNDEALRLLIAASPERDPMELLYRLVFFRYAVRHKLRVDVVYAKLMEEGVEDRRIVPLAVQSLDGIIDVTSQDIMAGEIRHLIMSRILEIKTDLRHALLRADQEIASLTSVDPSHHGEFGNPTYDCLLELRGHSYSHFLNRYLVDHEIVERAPRRVRIRLPGIGERRIRDIVFNYGEYCTLIEPPELRAWFRGIAEKIVRNHE